MFKSLKLTLIEKFLNSLILLIDLKIKLNFGNIRLSFSNKYSTLVYLGSFSILYKLMLFFSPKFFNVLLEK